jgi:hypothetical protein
LSQNYYYLIASLPAIQYGDKPPVAYNDFREQCNSMLSQADAALLQFCCYNPKLAIETVQPTGSIFIDLLMSRERTLNLNLAALRAAKQKRPSLGEPPHDVPRAEAVAKAAFEMDDPLEAEIYIDKSRWGALEDMVGIDYFGVNNVYAYLLKLQLLERRQRFDTEKGFAEYRKLYDSIVNAIPGFKEDR